MLLASPTKRARAVLGNATNTVPYEDKVRIYNDENSFPPSSKSASPRFALTDKKGGSSVANSLASGSSSTSSSMKGLSNAYVKKALAPKRAYNADFGIQKPRTGGTPLKKSYSPFTSSPPRIRKRTFSRIDPPSSVSVASSSSIDAILRDGASKIRVHPSPTSSVSSDSSDGGVPLIVTAADKAVVPDSWNFAIYEDTPEETLQNLMEHSACTLDISDDSDDERLSADEIIEKGKENIPPARLEEIRASGENAMQGVTMSPWTGPRRAVARENRQALGGLNVEDFYPPAPMKKFTGYGYKEKDSASVKSSAKGIATVSSGIDIWESGSEDESDCGGVQLPRSDTASAYTLSEIDV